jgi:hypothetical protein
VCDGLMCVVCDGLMCVVCVVCVVCDGDGDRVMVLW